MKVSIIIPCLYDRGWLSEAIRSALNQDFDNYEIILASDGNASLKGVADEYGIRFVLSDRVNLSHTQNVAIRAAEGEYIKGLADDDHLPFDCLKNLYNNIGEYSLIYADAVNFKGKNKLISTSRARPVTIEDMMVRNCIHGGTTMYRRDIFLEVGGRDETIDNSEDYDFYLNLLSRGHKFTFINEVVYYYRKHKKQKSKWPDDPHRRRTQNYIRKKYEKFIIRPGT